MRKARYIFLALVLLSGLLLGGCQIGESSSSATGGGTLNLYGIDPLTLDPAISGETTSHQYVMQLFSGLVYLGDDLQPAPDIARKWEVSNEGRTYTFYLNKDVSFHDGREVKAQDFKYSWERACDPATGSTTAATYLGDIVGVAEVLAGKTEEISGVRVLDDYTLEVTIDAPKSYFLAKMTYPTAFVVDKENVASGGGWWRSPNGTGPFKLKEWQENNLLVLERNERYYGEVAKLASVEFHLWAGIQMNLYETGEIDVAAVYMPYIDKATDSAGPFAKELEVVPEISFYYIGFNTKEPPFDDINLRRAFSMAIDKDKIVSLVFRDMVKRADGILPPGMPGFNQNLVGIDYNLAEAKALIARSKYGSAANLPLITLTTAGWGGQVSSELEAIVEEWRQNLGVEVTIRQLEPPRFLYYLKAEKDEMYDIGWVADYPHPQNFLEVLFHCSSENNYGEYNNPAVNQLLSRAGVEMDTELSYSLYQQAEQKIVDDAACIPLYFGENYILVKPYVNDYNLDPQGLVKLNKVSITPR